MRCKACDRKLEDSELLRKKEDESPEDLCRICLREAMVYWAEPDQTEVSYQESGIINNIY